MSAESGPPHGSDAVRERNCWSGIYLLLSKRRQSSLEAPSEKAEADEPSTTAVAVEAEEQVTVDVVETSMIRSAAKGAMTIEVASMEGFDCKAGAETNRDLGGTY